MIGPMITYDLAETIHEDRLETAAQARQTNSYKTASSLLQFKKRGWRFTIKNVFFAVVDKTGRLSAPKGHLPNSQ